ncbi:DUF2513 domain-containing protein [Enterobacter asburiae]
MKVDHDYLKGLLLAFEASDHPHTDIVELQKMGIDYDTDIFVFHMRLLSDRGLLMRCDGMDGFGTVDTLDGNVHWAVLPLRLTAAGHDFLDALRNKEVWSTLKTGFKDASMGTLMTVSRELLQRALSKQLDKYIG